jgi:hypothetical protein
MLNLTLVNVNVSNPLINQGPKFKRKRPFRISALKGLYKSIFDALRTA